MIQLHCKKCKEKKEINEYEIVTTKNNRKGGRGICPTCKSKLWGFLPKKNKKIKKIKKIKNTSSINNETLPQEIDSNLSENDKPIIKSEKKHTIEEEIKTWNYIKH